jgi:hypothetical protein
VSENLRVYRWTAVTVWVLGVAAQPFLRGALEPQILVVRLLIVGASGLLAGAAASTASRRSARPVAPVPAGR